MAHLQLERRVLSRPAEVWWSGFRATTLALQQAGWEIAAEESIYEGRIRLMLRSRDMRLYAITNGVEWDYYRQDADRTPLVFQVVSAAPRIECQRIPEVGAGWADFNQIDAQPQFIETKIETPDDLRIFATPLARTEELIVEPATVAGLLEQIRKMQAPEQTRIRERERAAHRREAMAIEIRPRQRFHAQILSLDDYREAA
jgi:hypothetical protein